MKDNYILKIINIIIIYNENFVILMIEIFKMMI